MKFLEKLIKKQHIMQRILGLNLKQFNLLVEQLEPHWKEMKLQKITVNRKRKIGGGRSYKFETLEHKLMIVLLYYKLYITQEFLGIIVDLDQANVSRLLKKMSPLIEKAADPELVAYLAKAKEEYLKQSPCERINNWGEFLKKHPDLKDISTDATEQKCFRSKDNKQQQEYYSGKKKQHSLKKQVSVSATGRILDVSKTYPGSVHDKSILDQEKTIQKLPQKTAQRFDSGYQGALQENPDYYVILPIKKPRGGELSKLGKEHNQAHSRRRVVAENKFAQIKSFRACGNLYRGPIKSHDQTFRNVAALINFRSANSAIIV
jgi:hypothetical protein